MTTPSKTPLTDSHIARRDTSFAEDIDFMRQLERELNEQTASHAITVGHCDDVIRERDALKAEVEELRKDKARLDWIDGPTKGAEIDWDKFMDPKHTIRQAIDAAMKGNQE